MFQEPEPGKKTSLKFQTTEEVAELDEGAEGTEGAEDPESRLDTRRTNSTSTADTSASSAEDSLTTEERALLNSSAVWRCCKHLVDCEQFDQFSGFLVLMNSLSMGVQTDFMARNVSEYPPLALRYIETSFCIVFVLEILLRLYVYRMGFFTMSGWRWNCFDLTVVSLQVFEEVMVFLSSAMDTGGSSGMSNFSFIRILRILRIVRIVRVVRILRLIRDLRTIVMSVLDSLRSLFWTVILLILIIYVTGMYFTQTVLDYRLRHAEVDRRLDEYYGSLMKSVHVLAQAISGGVDWGTLVAPLEDISPFMAIVFCCYVAFMLLAMMNVVTGVFVESVVENAKEDRDVYLLSLVRNLFGKTLLGGMISWDDFESRLDNKYMQEFFTAIDVDRADAKAVFKLLDIDGSGVLDLDEFMNGCLRLRGPARALDLTVLLHETRRTSRKYFMFAHQIENMLGSVDKELKALVGAAARASSAESQPVLLG